MKIILIKNKSKNYHFDKKIGFLLKIHKKIFCHILKIRLQNCFKLPYR
jgi:hypothetical protein